MTCISRLSSSIIPVEANKHKCKFLLLSAINMIHQKESYPAAQKSLCHSPTQWHDQNSRSRKFEIIKPTSGERKVYQAAQKSLKVSQHQTAPPRKFTRQLKKVWSPSASGWSLCSQSSPPRQTLAPANNSTQWKWKRWKYVQVQKLLQGLIKIVATLSTNFKMAIWLRSETIGCYFLFSTFVHCMWHQPCALWLNKDKPLYLHYSSL